jgi:N-acyl-D-aspartate/D-glutamate deacylase
MSTLSSGEKMKNNKKIETGNPKASQAGLLLKNGLIVDGTGRKRYTGDLLIKGSRIKEISEKPIEVDCPTMDCTGLVISPGFIDVHSHMDRTLAYEDHEDLKTPFTAQGCTTFVAGNCGSSVGSLRRNNRYFSQINLFDKFPQPVGWDSMAGYFDHLERIGLSHNLVMLAGHGTEWITLRGRNPNPFSPDERQSILRRLEEAMNVGAAGVSFGLQYEPDIFCPPEQVREVARLVKSKGKIMTVHGRAYSKVSGAYRERGGTPHNVLALQEMIQVARETGVRLQYSHLMFAGTKSFPSYEQCLEALDKSVDDGLEIMTDTYPYHCGYSVINVIMPGWFLANIPANYHDPEAVDRVERGLARMPEYNGFGFNDIQIMFGDHPELEKYEGWFLSDIALDMKLSPPKTALILSEKTRGRTHILNHSYSDMKIIDALIGYPSCLFMTDSTVSPTGLQNPASFGSFALVLQYARDRKLISLEEAVRKMTGATAERYQLKERGFLKKGYAADITVFDWQKVKDNNTVTETDRAPSGIEAVFINGRQVKKDGQVDPSVKAGQVIRL